MGAQEASPVVGARRAVPAHLRELALLSARAARRDLLARCAGVLGSTLLAGGVLGVVAMGVLWWLRIATPPGVVPGIGLGLGLLGGLMLCAVRRPSPVALIRRLDEGLGLCDRLLSGVALADADDGYAQLAVRDAERSAGAARVDEAIEVRFGRAWVAWPVALAAGVAMFWLPPRGEPMPNAPPSPQAASPAPLDEAFVQQSLESLRGDPVVQDAASDEDLALLEEIERELADGLLTPDEAAEQAAGVLDRAAERLDPSAGEGAGERLGEASGVQATAPDQPAPDRSAAQAAEDGATDPQSPTADALDGAGDTEAGDGFDEADRLAEALRAADFDRARDAADELLEQADRRSPEQREALADRLEELAGEEPASDSSAPTEDAAEPGDAPSADGVNDALREAARAVREPPQSQSQPEPEPEAGPQSGSDPQSPAPPTPQSTQNDNQQDEQAGGDPDGSPSERREDASAGDRPGEEQPDQQGNQPTDQPTDQPTGQLADQPPGQPADPSTDPTRDPGGQPTDQPTEQATDQPGAQEDPASPTPQADQPADQDVDQPSDQPAAQPSAEPSAEGSQQQQPTQQQPSQQQPNQQPPGEQPPGEQQPGNQQPAADQPGSQPGDEPGTEQGPAPGPQQGPQPRPGEQGAEPGSNQPQGQPGQGRPGEGQRDGEGVRDAIDRLESGRREQAQRLRERANDLMNGPPDNPQDQPAEPGPFAGDRDAIDRVPPQGPPRDASSERGFETFDARPGEATEGARESVVAEWFDDRPRAPGDAAGPGTQRGDGASQRLREAARGAERAVEDQAVPRRYRDLVRSVFRRLEQQGPPAQQAPSSSPPPSGQSESE
ncbi:MAG: hypothetical protein AAF356_02430 [Planctomycetota bacterium]